MRDIDKFYSEKEEPLKGTLLALKEIILNYHEEFLPVWKYRLPCFSYKRQLFCYLWVDRKTNQPYIGMVKGREVSHPKLIQGNRTSVKILMIDAQNDINVNEIYTIFDLAMIYYN